MDDSGWRKDRGKKGERAEERGSQETLCHLRDVSDNANPETTFYLLPSILEFVRTEIPNVSMCCRNTKTMFHKELGNYNLNFPKHEMSLFYFPHTKCHISMHQPPSRGTRGNMRATREHEGHHCNPSIKQSIN